MLGFSMIEILLVVSLSTFLFMPIITLLYSFYNGINQNHDDGTHEEMYLSKNAKITKYKNGLILVNNHLAQYSNDNNDCPVMEKISKDIALKNELNFSFKTIASSDMGFPTSTLATGLSLIGSNIVASVDSSSTTLEDVIVYEYKDRSLFRKSSIDISPGYLAVIPDGYNLHFANTSVNSQAHLLEGSFVKDMLMGTVGTIQRINTDINPGDANPTNIIKSFRFSGANSSTSPITKKFLRHGDLIVVGTQKTSLDEIHIFDASTGVVLSSINTEYGINAMDIYDSHLIILGPQDPEIQIYNVRNPTQPTLVSEYDLKGGSGNGRSIDIFGDRLYIGRSKGGEELMVFETISIVNDQGLVQVASEKVGHSIDALIPHRDFAMLFTSNQHGEVYMARLEKGVTGESISLENLTINLEGRVSDYICVSDDIILSILNTEYPFAILTYENNN
jgi:hypothetical protein